MKRQQSYHQQKPKEYHDSIERNDDIKEEIIHFYDEEMNDEHHQMMEMKRFTISQRNKIQEIK